MIRNEAVPVKMVPVGNNGKINPLLYLKLQLRSKFDLLIEP